MDLHFSIFMPTATCTSPDRSSDTSSHELKQGNLTIASLPTDALFQIATHLDCSSLLAVRMTCKTFYMIVQMRQIWQKLVRDIEGYAVQPLEETLVDYTITELAQWILRRTRTRDVWRGLMPPCLRTRTVSIPPHSEPQVALYHKLLPGGRWLLVGMLSTAMYFYDLDSAGPEPRLLYDPCGSDNAIPENEIITHQNVWIDESKPWLFLRIGGLIPSQTKPQAYVYQVEQIGHGANAALTATPISFNGLRIGRMFITSVALSDRHFLEVWEDLYTDHAEILVYPYGEAHGRAEYSCVTPIPRPLGGASMITELIHGNVFAMHARFNPFYIFEVVSDASSAAPLSIKRLHTLPISYLLHSEIYWNPDLSQVVVLTHSGLKSILIPHDKALAPTLTDLGAWIGPPYQGSGMLLGISASLVNDETDNSTKIILHNWDPTSDLPKEFPVSNWAPESDDAPNPQAFSEDIGRTILWRGGASFFIVDIV